MTVVLIPFDLTEESRSACDYAFELFDCSHCRFVLLHTYNLPNQSAELKFQPLEDTLDSDSHNKIYREVTHVKPVVSNSSSTSDSGSGSFNNVIRSYCSSYPVDIIILPRQQQKCPSERGNEAFSKYVRNVPCPVITIPDHPCFKAPEHVVIALDLQAEGQEQRMMLAVRHIKERFNARFTLLHIMGPDSLEISSGKKESLKQLFGTSNVSFTFLSNPDAAGGILQYLSIQQTDLLVMLPRKLNETEYSIQKSVTEQVMNQLNIPLLTQLQA